MTAPVHDIRKLDGGRVQVEGRFEPLLVAHALTDFESIYSAGSARMARDKSHKGRAILTFHLTDAAGEHLFYLKRHEKPSLWTRLRGQAGPARVEWENVFDLERLGIPTMTVVALGEDQAGGRSFLLTQAVPEALELDRVLAEGRLEDFERRRRLAGELGGLVRKLHGAELTHRDLYLSHFFLSGYKTGGDRLHLIDLQRVRRPFFRRQRWRVKDVAQLVYSCPPGKVSRTDGMRFLHAYFDTRRLNAEQKEFVARVLAKVRRITRHVRRKKGMQR